MAERAAGVQFRGTAATVKAFQNSGFVNWALFCGPDLIEAYEGKDENQAAQLLDQYLDRLMDSGSTATYSLRVYDKLPPDKKIRPKTEFSRSFRFALHEDRYSPMNERNRDIIERLDRMEAKLAVEDPPDNETPQLGGIGAFLNGLMENEEVKNALSRGLANLIDVFVKPLRSGPPPMPELGPASIGDVKELSKDQVDKVQAALTILIERDPMLGDHLMKIASVAQNNPDKYRGLISMLNLL